MKAPQSLPVERANDSQRKASDPRHSSWVSAHAGSGKTKVLTQRVMRLMVQGVPPGRILCLTYTKVAAANMAQKVFQRLAEWTRMDDGALRAALADIGEDVSGPKTLDEARRLFARAIDTPGGLRIQTIHAFCERLLHNFPFEARVPANFTVLEEGDSERLLERAIEEATRASRRDAALAAAFAALSASLNEGGFAAAALALIKNREALAAFPDRAAFLAAAKVRLGLAPDDTLVEARRRLVGDSGDAANRRRWVAALAKGGVTDAKLAEAFRLIDDPTSPLEKRTAALIDIYFDGEGAPKSAVKGLGSKAVSEAARSELAVERGRVQRLREPLLSAQAAERSAALFTAAKAVAEAFARAKSREGALDYDDLTASARALLEGEGAGWVLYKLDATIEHILVDEAQDTSADQWRIVAALCEDWLSGKGRGGARSIFVVGDEKQSIYAFSGARPELLNANQRAYGARHKTAELPFSPVTLDVSFRSAPAILQAVDAVIKLKEVYLPLTGQADTKDGVRPSDHIAAHGSLPGLVEIWPPLIAAKAEEGDDWLADPAPDESPAVKLANRIARLIKAWLAPGSQERIADPETGAPRPIRAGDVMILVRKRSGGIFEAVNRALKRVNVPTAGADRLSLDTALAAMDLVALGRAILTPQDDLALAVALKSPLFGFDDDDLTALAPRRSGPLLAALQAGAEPRHRAAAEKFARWTAEAASRPPFDFFVWLLGAEGARKAFVARLGAEANDALDEFLALALSEERRAPASLQALLDTVQGATQSIRRDLDAAGDLVRVMTVHAAKGLEAPIVFLPDTLGKSDDRGGPPGAQKFLFPAPADDHGPQLFLWPGPKAGHSEALKAIIAERDALEKGEHRRLLYVAMTRAAERLIVCCAGGKEPPADSWYGLIGAGLNGMLQSAPAPWDAAENVRRFGSPQGAIGPSAPAQAAATVLPDWLGRPLPAEAAPMTRRASAEGFGDAGARAQGRFFHALLERLAELPAQDRARAAAALPARPYAVADDRARPLREKALAVLAAPHLAPFFAPGSRGEVAILTDGAAPLDARIDRLAPVGEEIWIADFKVGAKPPKRPAAYVAQMALYRDALALIYPGRTLRAHLIWAEGAEADEIPAADLDAAPAPAP